MITTEMVRDMSITIGESIDPNNFTKVDWFGDFSIEPDVVAMIEEITDSTMDQFGPTKITARRCTLLTFLIAVQVGRADAAQQMAKAEAQ